MKRTFLSLSDSNPLAARALLVVLVPMAILAPLASYVVGRYCQGSELEIDAFFVAMLACLGSLFLVVELYRPRNLLGCMMIKLSRPDPAQSNHFFFIALYCWLVMVNGLVLGGMLGHYLFQCELDQNRKRVEQVIRGLEAYQSARGEYPGSLEAVTGDTHFTLHCGRKAVGLKYNRLTLNTYDLSYSCAGYDYRYSSTSRS